jgi:hypothetical protein
LCPFTAVVLKEFRFAMTRQSVVLLGASNLVLGWPDLIHALHRTIAEPVDLSVAMGMGRSYLTTSSFWFRQLPAIRNCGLWDTLPRDLERPPYVLITDLGNDIVYLFEPDQIAACVRECMDRIRNWRADARIVMTGLPIASLTSVRRLRFLIARSILFPGCKLSLPTILERALALEHMAQQLAAEFDIPLVEPEPHWFGLDPIHVVPRFRPAAFSKYFAAFRPSPVPQTLPDKTGSGIKIRLPSPAESMKFGSRKTVEQPVFQAPELTVSAW